MGIIKFLFGKIIFTTLKKHIYINTIGDEQIGDMNKSKKKTTNTHEAFLDIFTQEDTEDNNIRA